jgi:hypothetical protein
MDTASSYRSMSDVHTGNVDEHVPLLFVGRSQQQAVQQNGFERTVDSPTSFEDVDSEAGVVEPTDRTCEHEHIARLQQMLRHAFMPVPPPPLAPLERVHSHEYDLVQTTAPNTAQRTALTDAIHMTAQQPTDAGDDAQVSSNNSSLHKITSQDVNAGQVADDQAVVYQNNYRGWRAIDYSDMSDMNDHHQNYVERGRPPIAPPPAQSSSTAANKKRHRRHHQFRQRQIRLPDMMISTSQSDLDVEIRPPAPTARHKNVVIAVGIKRRCKTDCVAGVHHRLCTALFAVNSTRRQTTQPLVRR